MTAQVTAAMMRGKMNREEAVKKRMLRGIVALTGAIGVSSS
jgi:hypothetical protein